MDKNDLDRGEPPIVPRRARMAEIAKLAGVGIATVDRVLNGRPNVREETRQRVLQAKAAIETGAQPAARNRPWRLKVFLPGDAGPSTEYLADCFQEEGSRGNAIIECVFTQKMEPAVLARKLRACSGQGIDAVAFQALEDPRVRHAVEDLKALGIPCLALLSPLESPDIIGYAGIDNRAAGRTAGLLAGRMLPHPGKVAVLTGGQLYRAHEDREMGFRAALRGDYRHLEVIGAVSGMDDIEGNRRAVLALLETHPDVSGIYNVGGGNEGVVRALQQAGAAGEILMIGHNLTPKTRGYLLEGAMDIVLHQNMHRAAQEAVAALTAHLEHRERRPAILPVEIITRENTEGADFG